MTDFNEALELVNRVTKALETKGREPRSWPISLFRADVEMLLRAYLVQVGIEIAEAQTKAPKIENAGHLTGFGPSDMGS